MNEVEMEMAKLKSEMASMKEDIETLKEQLKEVQMHRIHSNTRSPFSEREEEKKRAKELEKLKKDIEEERNRKFRLNMLR